VRVRSACQALRSENRYDSIMKLTPLRRAPAPADAAARQRGDQRLWLLSGLLAAAAAGVFLLVDIGIRIYEEGQPFAELLREVAGFTGLIVPVALLTACVLGALRGLIRADMPLGARILVYTQVGLAYWIGVAGIDAALVHLELHPVYSRTGFLAQLPRSLAVWALNSLTLYVMMAALFAAARALQEAHAQALREARLRTELSEARMRALSAQLDPHFLYNTLHVASALMRKQAVMAKALLADLSELLAASLAQSDQSLVPLAEEVRLVERYVAIQQARFAGRLSVELDIAPEALSAAVPRLLLQPLVENAVQHGTSQSVEGGWVRVRAAVARGRVVVSVANSSPAGTQASPLREGIGIGGIRARLALLFGEEAAIRFSTPADGQFSAEVDLPIRTASSSVRRRGETGGPRAGPTGYDEGSSEHTPRGRAPQVSLRNAPAERDSHTPTVGHALERPWVWAVAWLAIIAAFIASTGLLRLTRGLPFAASAFQIVQGVALVLPAALFSPLVVLALNRIRSGPRAAGRIALAYAAVGVAYWIAWTYTLYGLHLIGFYSVSRTPLQALAFSAGFAFAVFFLHVVLFEAAFRLRESRRQEIQLARLHLELSRTEEAAFRARLNPAFLFDTFRLVAELMDRDVRQARRLLADLSELLRSALGRDGGRWITLQTEIRLLERYLAIQQARFGMALELATEIDPDTQATRVPPLLLQPLADAVVAGRGGPCAHTRRLRIGARVARDGVSIVLAVEGCRCASDSRLAAQRHEAFATMRTRLDALYGAAAGLTVVESAHGRFRAEVSLPPFIAAVPDGRGPAEPAASAT
jgi:LytS/YehU family sensor histidine kinase